MPIRPYQPTDRSECLEIFTSNGPDYFDPSEREGLEEWLDGQDTGQIAYSTSAGDFFYVLERDQIIVACGGFYLVKNTSTANMVWGMVARQHHRQGLGRELFQFRTE